MPTAYRFRMYQGNGSTCPRARIRSSLISAKVRARCRYNVLTSPLSSLVCVLEGITWVVLTLTLRSAMSRRVHIGLEKVTQGLARATSHRVLAPAAGSSPRYSIPFFQNLAQDVRLSKHVLQRTFSPPLSFRFININFAFFSVLLFIRFMLLDSPS
jgi:hypothetical protein